TRFSPDWSSAGCSSDLIATLGRRDPACIIYTSGTSGAPRGVLLHHGAILCNVDGAAHILAGDFGWGDERFLSFLPLSHALEHTRSEERRVGKGPRARAE